MTMSISRAPSKIARCVSYRFTSAVVAPSGNPTTEQTPTPLPDSSRAQSATQVGLTQTVAKRNCAASRHSSSMFCARRVGLEQRVIDHRGHARRRPAERVQADTRGPGVDARGRSRSGQQSPSTPWHAHGAAGRPAGARTPPSPTR